MPSIRTLTLTLMLLTRFAGAEDDPAVPISGRVGDSKNDGPVEGAQVYVSDATGRERVVVTDRAGHYTIDVKPGTYEVTFTFGKSRTRARVSVEPGHPAALDGKVDSASGEVIVIQEKLTPKVLPKPRNYAASKAPPYSQEALDKDAWTRAWMVLEISPAGGVTRFKFLKRPGYDLENIAASEVFKLTFDPARDDHGKAVPTWLVWGIEWPSNGWLDTFHIPRTMMPPFVGFPPHRMSDYVPCKGSGPMNLKSYYPTYRDCSVADLSQMPNEPWIVKP